MRFRSHAGHIFLKYSPDSQTANGMNDATLHQLDSLPQMSQRVVRSRTNGSWLEIADNRMIAWRKWDSLEKLCTGRCTQIDILYEEMTSSVTLTYNCVLVNSATVVQRECKDPWTLSFTGGLCYGYDTKASSLYKKTDKKCAKCAKGGCLCLKNPNQCVQCGHEHTCGGKVKTYTLWTRPTTPKLDAIPTRLM